MSSLAYRRYALAVMTATYCVSLFDRGLMAIFAQSIKLDLGLTDSQLGFVMGIAFGVLYATLGVPLARWADYGNRVNLLSVAMAVWSATMAASFVVGNFAQLVALRVLAAVGDAGCKPPVYSLIADYFPDGAERTRALYRFELAVPIASVISFVLAGWLNEAIGWRFAFFLAALPGLCLAILLKTTLVEPRTSVDREKREPVESLRTVLALLWRQPSSRHLGVSIVLFFVMAQGLAAWTISFMIRTHHMGTTELGLWNGLIMGLGIPGLMVGSWLVERWFSGDDRGQLRLAALGVLSSCLMSVLLLLAPVKYGAIAAQCAQAAISNAFLVLPYIVLQRLVPDSMRATAMMAILMIANLCGMGIGIQLVGVVSDLLAPRFGEESLRYAMLTVTVLGPWSAWHLWRAGQTVAPDVADPAIRI